MKHEEHQYLEIMQECIDEGFEKSDRTGVGTRAIYGRMMNFDLTDGKMPLFTTKSVFWRGVLEELLWFIGGNPDSTALEEKGVNIWKGNTSREFLDSRNLNHYEEGEIGPGYGFQWRNWNGDYERQMVWDEKTGIDQLQNLANGIIENPESRRHILTAWNPAQLHEMALPPCHVMSHYAVINGMLHCSMFQRSADVCCGVPFNVASYALLTHLLARHCELLPGTFTWFGADVHVYCNHIETAKEQISRTPFDFPKIQLPDEVDLFSIRADEIKLVDYKNHGQLKYEMAI